MTSCFFYPKQVRKDLHPDLSAVFRPLTRDDATNSFLMRSSRRPWVVNWAQSAACTQLRKFMSLTDANAMLGRGKMQVLTEAQARDLLAIDDDIPGDIPGGADSSPGMNPSLGTRGVLLDVGAGEGGTFLFLFAWELSLLVSRLVSVRAIRLTSCFVFYSSRGDRDAEASRGLRRRRRHGSLGTDGPTFTAEKV